MQQVEENELIIFNYINTLNKKIYKIEANMRSLFFENVEVTSNEEIVPPIVSKKGFSEFEKIRHEIKCLDLEIKDIDKKMANLQSFTNSVVENLKGQELSKEEFESAKQSGLEKIKMELQEQKNRCIERIKGINDDPTAYLRFLEFQSCDFSNVRDKEIREILNEQNGILKGYKSKRDEYLKKIKKSEVKENGPTLLFKKSSKKGIDKK